MFTPFFPHHRPWHRHRGPGRGFGPFDSFGPEWREAWAPFGRGGPGGASTAATSSC